MPESHRYYYLENKMNAEAYKSWQGSMVQMFTNLFVRLLVHFVMKNKCNNQVAHMIVHHVVEVATNTPVNPVYFYLGSEKFVLAFVGFV